MSALVQQIEERQDRFAQMLPPGTDPGRFVSALTSAVASNPRLQNANRASLFQAAASVAYLGLTIGVNGEAHLVPIGGSVTPIVGFSGYVRLMKTHGGVLDVSTAVVRESDTYRRTHDGFVHEWDPFVPDQDRGEIVGAWCRLVLADGAEHIETINRDKIERARMASRAGRKNIGPWAEYPEEMARKSAVREARKYVVLTPEISRHLDEVEVEDFALRRDPQAARQSAEQAFGVAEPIEVEPEDRVDSPPTTQPPNEE